MLARLRSGSSYFVPRPASTTSRSEILAHAMQIMAVRGFISVASNSVFDSKKFWEGMVKKSGP